MGRMRTLPSTLYGPVNVIFGDIISKVIGLARSIVNGLQWKYAIEKCNSFEFHVTLTTRASLVLLPNPEDLHR